MIVAAALFADVPGAPPHILSCGIANKQEMQQIRYEYGLARTRQYALKQSRGYHGDKEGLPDLWACAKHNLKRGRAARLGSIQGSTAITDSRAIARALKPLSLGQKCPFPVGVSGLKGKRGRPKRRNRIQTNLQRGTTEAYTVWVWVSWGSVCELEKEKNNVEKRHGVQEEEHCRFILEALHDPPWEL